MAKGRNETPVLWQVVIIVFVMIGAISFMSWGIATQQFPKPLTETPTWLLQVWLVLVVVILGIGLAVIWKIWRKTTEVGT